MKSEESDYPPEFWDAVKKIGDANNALADQLMQGVEDDDDQETVCNKVLENIFKEI